MIQKKHRISPEDIDLKVLRKELQKKGSRIRFAKNRLKRDDTTICGTCVGFCDICITVFPEGYGRKCCCPCAVYLKKDVAHVVEYLLLNLNL